MLLILKSNAYVIKGGSYDQTFDGQTEETESDCGQIPNASFDQWVANFEIAFMLQKVSLIHYEANFT